MSKPPNYGGNPYGQGTKSFRSRKQIQALVVNTDTTHNEHTVLTAAWKDTQADRVVTGQAQTRRTANTSKPKGVCWTVEAAANRLRIAGIKPGPSEAINEHTPLESRADQSPVHHLPLSGGTCRGITSSRSAFHYAAPASTWASAFYSGAA